MQAATHLCNASPHGYFVASLPWALCSISPMGTFCVYSQGYVWITTIIISPVYFVWLKVKATIKET